jgi:hypothetical protein
MGTWGANPFENDSAADFLAECETSASRTVTRALRSVAERKATDFVDIDNGNAAWASCALVALAFGQGDATELDDNVLDVVARLKPKEEQRILALDALAKLQNRTTSELAALWHEGDEGAKFDAAVARLKEQLQAASAGPRELPKPKTGDVIGLPVAQGAGEWVIVQIIGAGEVAVFGGTCFDGKTALARVANDTTHRVPTAVGKLLRRGCLFGNVPVRKELKKTKLYAGESGAIDKYLLATAGARQVRSGTYDEARELDVLRRVEEETLIAIAHGTHRFARVRSPDERKEEVRQRSAESWIARRKTTTPGPFGDPKELKDLVTWLNKYGIENALRVLEPAGHGWPDERSERRSYAFAAIVALWRGTWDGEPWPPSGGEPPGKPEADLLKKALVRARILADAVVTRGAELRMIWEEAPDAGARFREIATTLRRALE